MNWEAIGAIGEIVGAAAVVASLLYLAIQTRSNAKALRANAIWDAETVFARVNYDHAGDPVFADIASKAFQPDAKIEDFTETEMNQFHFAARGCFQYMQAQWSLWREGILPEDIWERRRVWTCGLITLPLVKPIWEAEIAQAMVSEKFRSDVESALEKPTIKLRVGKSATEQQ